MTYQDNSRYNTISWQVQDEDGILGMSRRLNKLKLHVTLLGSMYHCLHCLQFESVLLYTWCFSSDVWIISVCYSDSRTALGTLSSQTSSNAFINQNDLDWAYRMTRMMWPEYPELAPCLCDHPSSCRQLLSPLTDTLLAYFIIFKQLQQVVWTSGLIHTPIWILYQLPVSAKVVLVVPFLSFLL